VDAQQGGVLGSSSPSRDVRILNWKSAGLDGVLFLLSDLAPATGMGNADCWMGEWGRCWGVKFGEMGVCSGCSGALEVLLSLFLFYLHFLFV